MADEGRKKSIQLKSQAPLITAIEIYRGSKHVRRHHKMTSQNIDVRSNLHGRLVTLFCSAADARVKRFSILSLFWKFFYLMYLLYLLLVVLHLLRGRFVEGAVCLLKLLTGNNLDVKYGFCAVRVTWRSFQFYLWLWQDIVQYAEEFAAALMAMCRGALVAFPLLYKGSFMSRW